MSARFADSRLAICLAALVVSGALVPTASHGQAFEKVVPRLPPVTQAPKIEAPPPPTAASQDQTVLVPELKGVVFVSGPAALQPAGVDPTGVAGGVAAPGLPLLSGADFAALVRPYIGKPLTRAGLEAIANLARGVYRAKQRPFINVSAPPQNVQSGVIQVVVTEYRVGQIMVIGNRYFSTAQIRRMSGLKTGDVLTLPRLREDLGELNQNAFLTVNAVVKPGGETGVSDVTLMAEDRRPLRFYAGYDNQGVPNLGRNEWNVGVNWGNGFGLGQTLSYQFTRSFTGDYTSHSASGVIPLQGHQILLFGAYAIQTPQIATGFDNEGRSAQASGRFDSDLPGSPRLKQDLEFGFDYKRTNNNLEFGGVKVLDTTVEIDQFLANYNLTINDSHGQTAIENTLVFSPGNLTQYNTDSAIRQFVAGARAQYVYDRFAVTRTTFLPHGLTWIIRGLGQVANHNLPFSEQIGGGGIGALRGYDPNAALGSEGVLLSQEVRAPVFSFLRLMNKNAKLADQMQFGVFWDYANLSQLTPLPDLPQRIVLSSLGFNIHYSVEPNLHLQLEVGSQLRRAPFHDDRETRVAVVTSVSF